MDLPEEIIGYPGRLSSIGYRHMCRFFSGQIFKREKLKEYRYAWRLDADAVYFCNITYDPFEYMRTKGLKYGWNILNYEEPIISSKTLWNSIKKYIDGLDNPDLYYDRLNSRMTIYGTYDRCHYWNNFEIMDLDFFRGDQYSEYFNFLDKEEGFYLYRWGDALVRTLGVQMLLEPHQIHRFNDIGYYHQGICINPCKDDTFQCSLSDDGITGFCRPWHSKICTVENHAFFHSFVIFMVVIITIGIIWLIKTRNSTKQRPFIEKVN